MSKINFIDFASLWVQVNYSMFTDFHNLEHIDIGTIGAIGTIADIANIANIANIAIIATILGLHNTRIWSKSTKDPSLVKSLHCIVIKDHYTV